MTMTEATTTTVATDWVARAAELAPRTEVWGAEADRTGAFVDQSVSLLRAEGFLRAPVPTELGGGGMSHAEACAVLRALGRSDGAVAVTLSMHYHLTYTQVWRHLHGQPAETILRRIASEDLLLVSTGASDWLGSNGTARAVDGGFRVSARKAPSSGAPAGDLLVTSIRWDDAPGGPQVLHCAVPFTAEGVSVEETWDTLGLRGTGSHTVVLDDVFVPDAAVSLARGADVWHPVWSTVLGTALPLIMAAYVGIADRAVDEALSLATTRADRPETASSVGTMLRHHAMAEDALAAMIREADDLRFVNTDAVAAHAVTRKSVVADAVEAATRAALDVAGGAGYSRAGLIERCHRDALGARYHPLPAAPAATFAGRVAMGLPPVG
jgi:alkylation response protein AidB-like acyl-CoA dehydrogenase